MTEIGESDNYFPFDRFGKKPEKLTPQQQKETVDRLLRKMRAANNTGNTDNTDLHAPDSSIGGSLVTKLQKYEHIADTDVTKIKEQLYKDLDLKSLGFEDSSIIRIKFDPMGSALTNDTVRFSIYRVEGFAAQVKDSRFENLTYLNEPQLGKSIDFAGKIKEISKNLPPPDLHSHNDGTRYSSIFNSRFCTPYKEE
jgi:hypothetical protein